MAVIFRKAFQRRWWEEWEGKLLTTELHLKRKPIREPGGTEDWCRKSCHLWGTCLKPGSSWGCHLPLRAAGAGEWNCTNNGYRFNSTEKDQWDKWNEVFEKQIGATGWGSGKVLWGEESKTQKMLKMAAEQPAGEDGCHKTSTWNLECMLGQDSKLQQDATCCSKQMKHERCLRWWHYFD